MILWLLSSLLLVVMILSMICVISICSFCWSNYDVTGCFCSCIYVVHLLSRFVWFGVIILNFFEWVYGCCYHCRGSLCEDGFCVYACLVHFFELLTWCNRMRLFIHLFESFVRSICVVLFCFVWFCFVFWMVLWLSLSLWFVVCGDGWYVCSVHFFAVLTRCTRMLLLAYVSDSLTQSLCCCCVILFLFFWMMLWFSVSSLDSLCEDSCVRACVRFVHFWEYWNDANDFFVQIYIQFIHLPVITLCCFVCIFWTVFDNDFPSGCVTHFRLRHLLYCIQLSTYFIDIPTLHVYSFLIFAHSLCIALLFPLWIGLFEYDSRTGHFIELECRIILVAHAFFSFVYFHNVFF